MGRGCEVWAGKDQREDVHEVSGINKNEVSSLQHDSIPVSRGSVARSDMALSGDSVSGKV